MAEFLLNVIQLEIMARSWISEDHLGLDASAAVVGDAAITAHLWGNSEGRHLFAQRDVIIRIRLLKLMKAVIKVEAQ